MEQSLVYFMTQIHGCENTQFKGKTIKNDMPDSNGRSWPFPSLVLAVASQLFDQSLAHPTNAFLGTSALLLLSNRPRMTIQKRCPHLDYRQN
jgi:hypothetical protein